MDTGERTRLEPLKDSASANVGPPQSITTTGRTDGNHNPKLSTTNHLPTPSSTVTLDGTQVKCCKDSEYLGMRINNTRGIICKDPKDLLPKGKTVAT